MTQDSLKNGGCKKVLLKADLSEHYYQFKLPDGEKSFKTISGSIFTLLFGMLVIVFASVKFQVFWQRSDYHILDKAKAQALTPGNFKFGTEDNFAIAAAFWSPKGPVRDPEIGELKFLLKSWASATDDVHFEELKLRPCTKEDFEPSDEGQSSKYGFHELDEASQSIINDTAYDLRCIAEPFNLYGDFNTASA